MVFKVGFLNQLCGGGVGRDSGDLTYPASQLFTEDPALRSKTWGGEGWEAVGCIEQLRYISSYSGFEPVTIQHWLPAF